MKKVWDWFYGNLMVLSAFTAIWFVLALVSLGNGGGTFLDGLMMAQISNTLTMLDLAVYIILVGFTIIWVVRAFRSNIWWSLLFLANAAAAIIWYASGQPNSGDWSAFVPYITTFLAILMAANVVFSLLHSRQHRIMT